MNRGEYLTNPLSGERIAVIARGATTGGQLYSMDYFLAPGGNVREHFHPNQEMTIRVLSGTLSCTIGGTPCILEPGQSAVLPPGTRHTQSNLGTLEVHAIEEYRPALAMDSMFESAFRFAASGAFRSRIKGPLQAAAFRWKFRRESRPGQRRAFLTAMALAPIALLLGYRGRYEERAA